jgi:hypothetical protein
MRTAQKKTEKKKKKTNATMPSLDVVIQDICGGCAKTGLIVSEVLAAFIARTVYVHFMCEFALLLPHLLIACFVLDYRSKPR